MVKIKKQSAPHKKLGKLAGGKVFKSQKTKPLKVEKPAGVLEEANAKKGLAALFKLVTKLEKSSNSLFEENQAIFLQICAIKVGMCPTKIHKIPVSHCIGGEELEVCLITPDVDGKQSIDIINIIILFIILLFINLVVVLIVGFHVLLYFIC